MSELNYCPECEERYLEKVLASWHFGWHVRIFVCHNCDYYESDIDKKIVPAWLYWLLVEINYYKKFFVSPIVLSLWGKLLALPHAANRYTEFLDRLSPPPSDDLPF